MTTIEVHAAPHARHPLDAVPRGPRDRLLPAASLLTLGVGAGLSPMAHAATFTVSNLDDAGDGSLREAIADANAAAGDDIVVFEAGVTGTITLSTGELTIADSVDIQGPGAATLTVSGGNASRVFYLYSPGADAAVTLSGLTIADGNAPFGGAVTSFGEDLTLRDVVVTGNTGEFGGAVTVVQFYASPTVVIAGCTISGNSSSGQGGGIHLNGALTLDLSNTTISDNTSAVGGGVFWLSQGGARTGFRGPPPTRRHGDGRHRGGKPRVHGASTSSIRNTTVSDNTATVAGGGLVILQHPQPLRIENSTISGNDALGTAHADGNANFLRGIAGTAGGMVLYYTGDVALNHVTISGNSASTDGGGVLVFEPSGTGSIEFAHCIIADNTGATNPDIGVPTGSPGVRFSLIEVPNAAITDNGGNLLNQDAQLGPLADNGGDTRTHLPAATSPVVNAGDAAFAPPPTTDQRGLPRVQGGGIDIGSIETVPPMPGTVQLTAIAVAAAEGTPSLTLFASRTGGDDGAISVAFASADGTATAPADYDAAGGALNWADGDSGDKIIAISIFEDAVVEGAETFTVTLSNPGGGATLGANATATVTIADNDVLPGGSIAFAITGVTVNEADGTATLSVSRSASARGGLGPATVDFATTNGTATAPGDFTATTGTLSWSAGDTSAKSIVVPIVLDAITEATETFTIALTNPTGGATIAPGNGTATVTIQANATTGTPLSIPATSLLANGLLGGLLAALGMRFTRRKRHDGRSG